MTAVSQGDEVPTLDVDPFSLEFLDEPYPHYQRMRDIGPLVRLRAYEVWGMARFNEVHAALRDPATYCSSAGVGLSDFRREEPWRAPSLLLEADPPEHDRARRVITKVLTPMVVGELRASFEAKVEQLVDELVEVREFDAVEDLAVRFPMTVFPDAVGLQQDGRANLLRYSTMAFNAFGPRNSLFERSMVGVDSAREWIMDQCRREALRPGAIGARVHDVAAEEGYGSEEADLLVRSLLSAGVDTTVHGIENAIYCFTRHPDQWARLRTDPSLARAAFEEAVRYESPVQTFFRTTTREVEVGDVVVPEGEKVLLFLGSANRDPRHWGESADQFDIQRRAAGHVGFGSGIHACVGQMLARLEGELVLTALAKRVKAITCTDGPERQLNNTLRGLDHLPVVVEAA